MKRTKKSIIAFACIGSMMVSGLSFETKVQAANPYLPLWEHIPDGEPYVFEDPDNPGQYRAYVYGSHDIYKTVYCGDDQVVWSAPVDDLNNWRKDGVIFQSVVNGAADTLYAPSVAEVKDANGKKTYYLYPNNRGDKRQTMIAKSDSPKGPFVPCNWKDGSTTETVGDVGYDPAVFVDDDGKVYGYWGFETSYGAELDPTTMCTVKSGTSIVTDMVGSHNAANDGNGFGFFEASSIRKVNGKYVFIYSRTTKDGEFGIGASNNTLAYAYSDHPLGPWTYGGTIIDARGREKDANGNTITTNSWGNTHGSIVQIDGQWYIFYHRCINNDGKITARQGTVEPIDVNVTADGKVEIKEAEMTSDGFELNGLNPYENHSAGIACYLYNNPYVKATYDERSDEAPVINIKNNAIVGFKYFNFDGKPEDGQSTQLEMNLTPMGNDGTVDIMMDSPWESKGTKLGTVTISANDPQEEIKKTVSVPGVDNVDGKHAIYFVFKSANDKEICQFNDLKFSKVNTLLDDNFASGLDKWKINVGNPIASNDGLSMTDSTSVTSKTGFDWNNYTFDSNVNVSKGTVGLRFRQSDEKNYYEVQLKDGNVELSSTLYGTKTVLKTVPCDLKANESAAISINCVDDVISVRVNGVMVLVEKNDDQSNGTVGISTYDGASAKISNVQVQNSSTKDSELETRSISIDGVPMNDFDMFNYAYNHVVDGNTAPKVTATSSDENVKISISQADGVPGKALVRFISDKETKTYTIAFANSSSLDPNTFNVVNKSDTEPPIITNDAVTLKTGGGDLPWNQNLLKLPQTVSGNWALQAKYSMDIPIYDSTIAPHGSFSIGIIKNNTPDASKNDYRSVDDGNLAKVSITRNWSAAPYASATAIVTIKKDGNEANLGNEIDVKGLDNWVEGKKSVYWLRAVKIGNTLEGFFSADGIKYSSLGKATMSDDLLSDSKLYLYASNGYATTPLPFEITISDIKMDKLADDLSPDISPDQKAVEDAAALIGTGIAIPGTDSDDSAAKIVQAQQLLGNMNELTSLGVTCNVSYVDNHYVLDISKGTAATSIEPFSILIKREWSDFEKLVEQANALSKDDYTTASWNKLNNALDDAKVLDEKSDSVAIGMAYNKLKAAYDAVEIVKKSVISVEGLNDGGYTNLNQVKVSVNEKSGLMKTLKVLKDGEVIDTITRDSLDSNNEDETVSDNIDSQTTTESAVKVSAADSEYPITIDLKEDGNYELVAELPNGQFSFKFVYDSKSPTINYDEATKNVTVADENLETVTVNGNASDKSFTLSGNGTYKVEAVDKAGNRIVKDIVVSDPVVSGGGSHRRKRSKNKDDKSDTTTTDTTSKDTTTTDSNAKDTTATDTTATDNNAKDTTTTDNNSSNTIPDGWKKNDDNTWSYIKAGQKTIGWQQVNSIWYLLKDDGIMATGWQKVDGKWYLLNDDGAMVTGWQKVDGIWYYLYSDGSMASNTSIDGYQLGGNGAWLA